MGLRPGITTAIMNKNDAVRLGRALESAKAFSSELLVLDTGSSDDSIDVAKSHGARVIELPWPDAFDEALNFMLDHVQTEWTLRIDSDEWFLPEYVPLVSEIVDRDDVFLALIFRRDYQPDGGFVEGYYPRFWRTHPEMRYVGIIHEQIPDDNLFEASQGRRILPTQIRLEHDGYIGGFGEARLRRNLELIRRELDVRPGNVYYELALSDTLYELNDPEAPEYTNGIFDRLLRSRDELPAGVVAPGLAQFLRRQPEDKLNVPRVGKVIRYGIQHYGTVPEVVWVCANTELKRGRIQDGLELFLHLDRLRETDSYSRIVGVDPNMVGIELFRAIIQVATLLGRRDLVAKYSGALA